MATVDWVTSAEVKAQLEISGSGRDAAIAAAITSASRLLNRRSGREVTPQSSGVTRLFPVEVRAVRGDMLRVDLAPYDLRAATTVTVNPEANSPNVLVANSDYALWPVGGNKQTGTYRALRFSNYLTSLWSTFADNFGIVKVQVLGDWGIWNTASVPEDLKRACISTVGSWLDKAVAEYGPEFTDQPRIMQASAFDGYAVPRSALNILAAAGFLSTPIV